MTDTITIPRALLEQALDAIEKGAWDTLRGRNASEALRSALEQPQREPVLQDIEQYRMQMAGICTAAIGYWKPEDGIHPDYDTPALRDVANLYAKYREAVAALEQPQQEQEQEWLTGCPECGMDGGCDCPSGAYNPPKCKQCGDTLASAITELCYGCQQEGMQ